MCRSLTPDDKRTTCSRCGQCANPNDGWEHEWPNNGRVEIGAASQVFAPLCGAANCADRVHFEAWHRGHPAIVTFDAQAVVFEWGNGYKFDSTGRYRLCYECQRAFAAVIGVFFGMAEPGNPAILRDQKRMESCKPVEATK